MRSPGSLAQTEEGRAFLQRRTALYAAICAAIGGSFFALRAAGRLAQSGLAALSERSLWAHLVGAAAMVGLWLLHRARPLGPRALHYSEHAALLISCAGYAVMSVDIPQPFRPDLTLLLVYASLLLTRSVILPNTWRRTAGLCAAIGALLLPIAWLAFEPMNPDFARSFGGTQLNFDAPVRDSLVVNTAMWWLAFSAVASATSSVIYDLRREVRDAQRLGQYTLVRKIGEGGMGVVYEAKHALLRRPTAVKLLLPERVGEESLARFAREVRATAALSHPNTVTVFDYGRTPAGLFYYAMEYIEGATLTDLVRLEGALPPGRAVFLLHQVAGALAEAHDAGLVHRDVKPDNVLVTATGWTADLAKVVDFGLVKELAAEGVGVTREEAIVGTPQYMAPETIRGGDVPDPRSDLYALGGVAYFLLTGGHVFEAKTIVEICSLHLTETPTPPTARGAAISPALEALVLALLSKAPAERPASAHEVQRRLEATPEHGTWTREHAARWWQQLGPDVRAGREGTSLGRADTLAIELGERR